MHEYIIDSKSSPHPASDHIRQGLAYTVAILSAATIITPAVPLSVVGKDIKKWWSMVSEVTDGRVVRAGVSVT